MAPQYALLPVAATQQLSVAGGSSSLCCLNPQSRSPMCTFALVPKPSSRVSNYNELMSQLRQPQSEFHFTVQQQQPPPLTYHSVKTKRRKPNQFVVAVAESGGSIVFGCRIPQHYFVTKGFGETNEGGGADPYETGSYDIALEEAGIQDFNIQTYTSVMPLQAVLLTIEEAKPYFKHGAVLDCIMASINGKKGDKISAGVGRAKVRKISDQTPIGGYAAEYTGNAEETKVREILQADLQGIFKRRFTEKEYELYDEDYVVQASEVTKSYGTVLASICFISFINPIFGVSPSSNVK